MKSSGNGKRAPLRTLLQNFLNHVETMETKRSQGDDQYDREFQELKLLSESLKGVEAFSSKEGEKEVNRKKNRYKDILPFDYTRVILSEFPGVPGSDYINANYIRGASGSNAYIASQGPLAHTVTDFWRMIVECEVQVVVMACNEEESGKHKCECYWVDSDNDLKKYGPYSVKLLKFRRHCSDFSIRTMELSYVNADGDAVSRTIVQFHYWAWPDHGVPNLVRPLLEMVRLIRDCQASETLPLLVHCSAGCGRTGTICAIDYVWGLLKTGKLSEDFRLFELVADMRRQRVAMVQTKDQYVLVHQAVKELFLDQLKMIDAHPYENLDVNGHPLICPAEDVRIDPSYETIFANCSDGVLEVREEDDNYLDSSTSLSVPWPVLQFQAELEKQQGELESSVQHRKGMVAPPLPDKKRKSSQTGATLSTYDNVTSSGTSSKESSPPNSLERGDSKSSSAEKLEPESVKSKSASPSQSLVRRPSILKLRALFERSGSEPRVGEKRSKSANRKASSFRFNEAPRLQRAAESDSEANSKVPSVSSSNSAGSYKEFYKPPKLSLTKTALPADGESISRPVERPNLPVKRSKSMKVYRNFDVAIRNRSPEEVVITPAPCDIVLSKTPSITYVSSKEVLHSPTPSTELLVSPVENLPLATSSLDRTKEQKTKVTSPVCGSLDRGSQFAAQSREVPTYVNILMKNQEVSKLDDDTRQLLRDCQAYLMSSDDAPPVERSTAEAIAQLARDAHQRLMAVSEPRKDKSNRNLPPGDRKESFKQALLPEPELSSRTDESKKKTHEYEAVWLGSPTSSCPPASEEINANSLVSKDSIFVQKSDEIRHLLNELRSSPAEDQAKPTARLQPDRVLSELQQLVEESNKLHPDAGGRKPAYVNYPQPPPREPPPREPPQKITSPAVVRKELSGGVSKPRESKTLPPPKHSPSSSLVTPTQAPAFRPPPPYPSNLVVKLPPLAADCDPPPPARGTPKLESRRKVAAEPDTSAETSPKPHRRPPPEYKAPPDPPVKRPVQASPSVQTPPSAPVAPPRVKKTISSAKPSPGGAGAFPLGPPIPTRSYSSQQAAAAPGIDLDAVAAGMAATTTTGGVPPSKSRTSPNPSAAANRALSKALGKFQATAASFKTKLAQLGSEEKNSSSSASAPETPSTAVANPLPKMTRESSFVKSLGVYGNDAGVVNTSEATTYVRKKQQYL